MSRARIVCSEILSHMSPVNQFEEKSYSAMNSSQMKNFNLTINESSSGEVLTEGSDVCSILSEMNTSVEDWLRPKSACNSIDCMDPGYLSDVNFLSSKNSELCSSDIGLELILVDEKKDSNLSFSGINDKNSDLDCADPMLNVIPMNEVLLRKTDTKCDTLLLGKDMYVSDTETNLNKNRFTWDTLNIAKNDCDVDSSGAEFIDFNLLPFPFDGNDNISGLEPISDNVKNNMDTSSCSTKTDTNIPLDIELCNTNKVFSESSCMKKNNKKSTAVKRPNILRAVKPKTLVSDVDTEQMCTISEQPKTVDKLLNVDLLSTLTSSDSESVFDYTSKTFAPSNETEFTNLPEDIDPLTFPLSTDPVESITLSEEERKIMKRHRISEINDMAGSSAVVSNSVVNSKAKTKIVIRTNNGNENYEGYTAELMESVGRKNRRPNTPVEGEHVVTSVKTAATIKEEKGQTKVQTEPEDRLVRDMLSVLGITDDMLYTMVTNLGLRLWVCPEHDCRRIFNRLNTLKSHILSHYGLKPFKCDFPGCPWSFYTSFKLKRHRETHLKRKDFKCTIPDCNRTFTTIYNLNTHMKLHERPARLKCLVRSCNCKFQTRRAMEVHLKTHESSLAPYKCAHPGCNKLYFSCNALTAHSRSHQHKEEELRCQWDNCGRLFDKPCRLKAHMRQHTGDKPYVCKFKDCKWAFSSSSKLKRHQYKHNNERKFRCTIGDCTKAFMRSEHLREHTYTHIAQRTHQCSICGEKCPTKTTLDEHRKKFHPNEKSNNRKRKAPVTAESDAIILATTSASYTSMDQRVCEDKNYMTCSKDENINQGIILSIPDENNVLTTLGANAMIMQDRVTDSYDLSMLQVASVIPTPTTNDISNVCESDINGSKEKLKSQKKAKTGCKTNALNKSARTDLPYMVVPMKPDKKYTLVNTGLQESIDNTADSDEGYNDLGLPYFLEPPELSSNSDALCSVTLQDDAINTDLINPEDAQYILLLDSGTNSNFPESTINLRDLH